MPPADDPLADWCASELAHRHFSYCHIHDQEWREACVRCAEALSARKATLRAIIREAVAEARTEARNAR